MMTRKYFERIAKIIRECGTELDETDTALMVNKNELVESFNQMFKEENPRFDEKRFRKSCERTR